LGGGRTSRADCRATALREDPSQPDGNPSFESGRFVRLALLSDRRNVVCIFTVEVPGMHPPPFVKLWQIATGYLLPRCLHVVAELGVADHLGEEPATAEALARATSANKGSLHRMLRLLAIVGVFEERGGLWAHTDLSRLMRSDHPQSMRAFIRMMGGRMWWAAAGELEHAAHTGKAAAEKLAAGGMWSYFRDHPDEARIFDAAMTARSHAESAMLVSANTRRFFGAGLNNSA